MSINQLNLDKPKPWLNPRVNRLTTDGNTIVNGPFSTGSITTNFLTVNTLGTIPTLQSTNFESTSVESDTLVVNGESQFNDTLRATGQTLILGELQLGSPIGITSYSASSGQISFLASTNPVLVTNVILNYQFYILTDSLGNTFRKLVIENDTAQFEADGINSGAIFSETLPDPNMFTTNSIYVPVISAQAGANPNKMGSVILRDTTNDIAIYDGLNNEFFPLTLGFVGPLGPIVISY